MPLVEQGAFFVEFVGQGYAESEAKKTPYFYLQFSIKGKVVKQDGKEMCQPIVDGDGEPIADVIDLYLSDKSAEKTVEILRKLGWAGTSFASLDPSTPDHFTLSGTQAILYNAPREYQGKKYNNWSFNGGGAGLRRSNDSAVTQKLDSLFRSVLQSAPAPAKLQETQAPAVQEAPMNSEVPF